MSSRTAKNTKATKKMEGVSLNGAPSDAVGFSLLEQREEHILHAGPMPDPETLKQYKELIPDAPERFLALVESEQKHRQQYEGKIVDGLVKDSQARIEAQKRGDWIAILFFFSCLFAGCTILYLGLSTWLAGSLLGAPTITAIGTFLYNRMDKKHEQEQTGNGKVAKKN